jgi:protease-4
MAKTRDIIIGLIIGGSLLMFFLIMGVMLTMGRWDDGVGFSGLGDKVAIINLDGAIESSVDIVRQLDRWGKDSHVRAIVLHINSPGGGVAPSQEIYEKIMQTRRDSGKPLVASMSSVCASGGYYVACAADRIVAVPGTLTGSIGVKMEWPVVGRMLDKVGIRFETVKSSAEKDMGSPYREPTEADRAILQSVVDDTYQQFVDVLVERRGIARDSVLALADGSIYTGRQAKFLGLVDSLGTFDEAVDLAGELCGIGKNPTRIKESPRRRATILDLLGSLANLDLSGVLGAGQYLASPQLRYIFD